MINHSCSLIRQEVQLAKPNQKRQSQMQPLLMIISMQKI